MSQSSSDKYVYFTVGILKESTALEALKQDALKHHMIDQPGQLIALRLTEYYEMMNQGIVQPVVRVPAVMAPLAEPENKEKTPSQSPSQPLTPLPPNPAISPFQGHTVPGSGPTLIGQLTGRMRALRRENDNIIMASPSVDQNADEAADYWNTL